MFAICIATYNRKDGKTPFYLKRCLDSVKEQTCKDFKLFIVGDKYENDSEIQSLIPENAWYENLTSHTPEREIYTGKKLWCCAGHKAKLYATSQAISEGFEYLISLDHDEWWDKTHLQMFKDNLPFAWACTKSTHTKNRIFPKIESEKECFPFLPKPAGVIKSSACWNYSQVPLLPRNVFEETGEFMPGDMDLWGRMRDFITLNDLKSICINKLTCFRDGQGYAKIEFP